MTASEAKVLEVPPAVSLKRILIATDFSPASERALWHGLAIARRFGDSVDIVHIVDSLGFRMTGADVVAQAVELAQRDLKKLEAGLVRSGPLEGIPHRMLVEEESGEAWEALYRLIRKNDIDLVVLGTHGRTGLKKLISGSVAEEVFRHSPCPVLTVGPCVAPELIVTNAPQNILFPTDLSSESLQALPFAIEAARKCGAELTLIHVLPAISGDARGDRERVFEVIRSRLESLVPHDAGLVRTPICIVEEGYFPAVILNFVNAHQIDLIVLGLRSPEPYVNRLVWQHAYDIVCQARSPVLTLRSARP
jgi:nucleotide-binding universal stress UspA family protein